MYDVILGPLQSLMSMSLKYFYGMTVQMGVPSYGIAIIILTIIIKMILYPLTVKQTKSMKAMNSIAPKIKAIQDKYKDNRQKMNEEVARIYKEAGVNPVAGCLPMLVQMPFFITIFYAIKEFPYEGIPTFLWIHDLSQANPSDPMFILPALAGITTYLQTKQTMTEATPQNKAMLYMMPVMIAWFSYQFPAGLALYWVVSNFIQIAQQWFVARTSVAAQGEAR